MKMLPEFRTPLPKFLEIQKHKDHNKNQIKKATQETFL
jgi:hypothetical protein